MGVDSTNFPDGFKKSDDKQDHSCFESLVPSPMNFSYWRHCSLENGALTKY